MDPFVHLNLRDAAGAESATAGIGRPGSGPIPEDGIVLAIETSCDETAVAVMRGDRILSSEIASQATLHAQFGGVVPEVASRNHLRALRPLISRALEVAGGVRLGECAAIAATQGPGLATSLMVGFSAAKALAIGLGKPFIAVNHMEGHLLSPFHGVPEGVRPAVGLVVSGGHTMLLAVRGVGDYDLLGQTRDDAAGEAFDKVAKLLGLGYPGGPLIDQLARRGDPSRFDFPRSMLGSGDLNFSFSGLKTAVRYALPKLAAPLPVEDLCASFQDAVVDVLVEKTRRAVRATGINCVAVSGGVSCNSRLREKLRVASGSTQDGFELLLAEPLLCTDNAGMIAHVAMLKARRGLYSELTADVNPNLRL